MVSCSADASAHCTPASKPEPSALLTSILIILFVVVLAYFYLFVYVPFIIGYTDPEVGRWCQARPRLESAPRLAKVHTT